MKKWLIRVAVVLIVVILCVFTVGFMLPVEHNVSRTLQTKQSPQVIWDTRWKGI